MMKQSGPTIAVLFFWVGSFIFTGMTSQRLYGQVDTSGPVLQNRQIPWNAGFDVIVKMNGDIVYGLVKEVGPEFIRYQRTDIPDGPVYVIPTMEVYVISYRNQVKDYLGHSGPLMDSSRSVQGVPPVQEQPLHKSFLKDKGVFQHGDVQFALGFLRGFTKVSNASSYSSKATFPVILLGYEVKYRGDLQLGVQVGLGSHNFSKQQYDAYDSLLNKSTVKENIFGIYVYGRYYFSAASSKMQPYLLGGLGITSSNIITNTTISFTNGNSQVILVKSGTRSTGLTVTARVGTTYRVNEQLRLSLDAGVGLSVIDIGFLLAIK